MRDVRRLRLLALGAALLAVVAYAGSRLTQATSLEVLFDAPAFILTDQLGRPVSSQDLRGKVVVANFIYTNCPDICPLLSFQMQTLQEELRREGLLGGNVQLLSFTVDPERDTPHVLRAYAERHRADPDAWRFLTGPKDEVERLVVGGFYLGVQVLPPPSPTSGGHGKGSKEAYEVMHSGRFVLIDREWRVRAVPNADEWEVERAMRDVGSLLR